MSEPVPEDGIRRHDTASAARRAVAETVLVSVAVGLVAGVVWWLVAPEVTVGVRDGQTVLIASEAHGLFGVDVSFGIVGAAAGFLLGAAMLTRHREHPTAVLSGLVLGGVVGSVVAWQVGFALGPGPLGERTGGAADGVTLTIPLDLEATGVLLFWPITAVVASLVLGGVPPSIRSRGDAVSSAERSEPSSHP